jgi:hypothetical protein
LRRKLPYEEGTVFAVPLKDRKYAVGLIARCGRRGIALGYFFGPRREAVPSLAKIGLLDPRRAVLVSMFGDLGLIENKWPIIGRYPAWDRNQWLVPKFLRTPLLTETHILIEYDDKTLREIRNTIIPRKKASGLPEDGLSGSGAIEIKLSKLLK